MKCKQCGALNSDRNQKCYNCDNVLTLYNENEGIDNNAGRTGGFTIFIFLLCWF